MSDTLQDPAQLRPIKARLPFATVRTVLALMLREMSSTKGIVWQVLEPVGGIMMLAILFSAGFRQPSLGTNFAIYFATGMMPFAMYMSVEGKLANGIKQSRSLLGYPRVTIIDALLAKFVLNVIIQVLTSMIVLTAICLIWDTGTILDLPPILLSYSMAMALAMGIGLLDCYLTARFKVWSSIWGIVTRPLVIISGVIFLHDEIPEPYRTWLEWNPLVHVTGASRKGFYFGYEAEYVDPAFVFGVALVCGVVGILLVTTYYRELGEA